MPTIVLIKAIILRTFFFQVLVILQILTTLPSFLSSPSSTSCVRLNADASLLRIGVVFFCSESCLSSHCSNYAQRQRRLILPSSPPTQSCQAWCRRELISHLLHALIKKGWGDWAGTKHTRSVSHHAKGGLCDERVLVVNVRHHVSGVGLQVCAQELEPGVFFFIYCIYI